MKLNIKVLITILLLNLPFAISAGNRADECVDYARNHGDGLGKRALPAQCPSLVNNAASPKLHRIDPIKNEDVFAFENMLYSQEDSRYLYAGSNTLLEELISLRKSGKEIFVLSKKNGVLVYLDFLPGNVAPIRQLQMAEIDFATDIEVDHRSLYLLVKDQVLIFNREANTLRRKEKQKSSIQRTVNLPHGNVRAMALDKSKLHLYLLYSSKILRIDLSNDQHKVSVVKSDSTLSEKSALEFTDSLIIK